MINKIPVLVLFLLLVFVSAEGQAIKKVPNKKSDSAKADTSGKKAAPAGQESGDKPKQQPNLRQDEFIDRDGDGINDRVIKAKTPAVKNQQPKGESQPLGRQPKKLAAPPQQQSQPKPKVVPKQKPMPKIKVASPPPQQQPKAKASPPPEKKQPQSSGSKESESSKKSRR